MSDSADHYGVAAAAGTLRSNDGTAVRLPHRWTPDGMTVVALVPGPGGFTGAHLLHLSVAGCVLNDVYREAQTLGLAVDGVRVTASGGFTADWASSGIDYSVEVSGPVSAPDRARLLDVVDRVAEIPRAVRAGAPVAPRVGPAPG